MFFPEIKMKLTPQFPPSDNSNLRVGANSLILEVISSNEYFPFFLCKQLFIFAYIAYGCVVYVRLSHFQNKFLSKYRIHYIFSSRRSKIYRQSYTNMLILPDYNAGENGLNWSVFENDSLVAGNVWVSAWIFHRVVCCRNDLAIVVVHPPAFPHSLSSPSGICHLFWFCYAAPLGGSSTSVPRFVSHHVHLRDMHVTASCVESALSVWGRRPPAARLVYRHVF